MNPADLTTKDWSISLTEFGGIVTDSEDIAQCIKIILTTAKGSDPLRPEFGSDIFRYIDAPVNVIIPNVRKEIIEQVNRWEPRAQITSVTHKLEKENVIFQVMFKDTRTNTSGKTEIQV